MCTKYFLHIFICLAKQVELPFLTMRKICTCRISSRSKVKWRSKSCDMCGHIQWSSWPRLVTIGQCICCSGGQSTASLTILTAHTHTPPHIRSPFHSPLSNSFGRYTIIELLIYYVDMINGMHSGLCNSTIL